MEFDVLEARYVSAYVVWLRFRDGTSAEVDLSAALHGPVFEPLRDPEAFRQFRLDPQFHTLVWPNDVDLAPEYLYDAARAASGSV